ncbi:bifunctional DNA primase/polymerase [Streptomonospora litoralis]|uniref:DNA primase/polymerase bifunctional N-terminal domain-containing protein n=1 Tax=Streptomonospora litoralis TaxID=2498135 RepID=A0A4P6PYW5_9ACTN|nr:bifunctional DNA primase/polymerase [Streptomonospora litoralis]QBI53438.1 hypothetical protein EKD16_08220 [Streptomonospora litoralis]
MDRRCEQCPTPLPTMARRHARYCSARCRQVASRARRRAAAAALPRALVERDRWVRHSPTKVPLTTTGRPASSTDATTWSTYATAATSRVGAGLGLVLDGDGLVCLDLDHCLTPDGHARSWAQPLLDQLPATYIEVSPSGDGLHVWGYGDLAHGRRLVYGAGTVEVYGAGRYITVTHRPWHRAPSQLADLSAVLAELL